MRTINTNICLPEDLWMRAKRAALDRRISLNQLVKNGLALALGDSDTITVDAAGTAHNDLRGELSSK